MGMIAFNELPDSSRLWIFSADRLLSEQEIAELRSQLGAFTESWAAHRKDLTAGFDIRDGMFVLIGVDESKLPPSGCSIDSMVGALTMIGGRMGIELVDSPDIAFRDTDGVHAVTRDQFQKLANDGDVDSQTPVFDRTISRLGDLRSGKWEIPAGTSWHGRAFDLREKQTA
ncbi:MAG: hypothetical protein ABIR47_05740 [Candidatus Kapaibacterium sp.]